MDFEGIYTIIVLVFNCLCLILPGLPFAHLQLKGIHKTDQEKERERGVEKVKDYLCSTQSQSGDAV